MKPSFDASTLNVLRNMSPLNVLDVLREEGVIFWRRDPDYTPEKNKDTVRLFVSLPSGRAWEILITGAKWFDIRSSKGGGGCIDLVMHLFGFDFVKAVKFLQDRAGF